MSWADRETATTWDVLGHLGGFVFLLALGALAAWWTYAQHQASQARADAAMRLVPTPGRIVSVSYESMPWGSSTLVLPRVKARYTVAGTIYEHVRVTDLDCTNCGVVDGSVGYYSPRRPSRSAAWARQVIGPRLRPGMDVTVYYPLGSPADGEVRVGPFETDHSVGEWFYLVTLGLPFVVPLWFFSRYRLGRER